MRPEATVIFIVGFLFIFGGFLMVGYIADQYYPSDLVIMSWQDIDTGVITPINATYTFIMGIVGAFGGVMFGYKLAYDISIGKHLAREFEAKKRAIMAELMDELEKE